MMHRNIGEMLSNHRVVSLPPAASVRDAARAMKEAHVASVVVIEGEETIVGIFTERDLTDRVVAEGLDPERTALSAVMSRCTVTCEPGTTVREALRMLAGNDVRHMPVVENRHVVGVVSMRDFMGDELAVLDREKALVESLTEVL